MITLGMEELEAEVTLLCFVIAFVAVLIGFMVVLWDRRHPLLHRDDDILNEMDKPCM